MLQELREQLVPPLTRSALAELLNRSPNYVLKAESLTFPSVPPSLLDFYTTRLEYPRTLLVSQYRDAQRHRRRNWLNYWEPVVIANTTQPDNPQAQNIRLSEVGETLNGWPLYLSFTRCWTSQFPNSPYEFPTEYAVSQGLCIPAAAVYKLEKTNRTPSSVRPALHDLIRYCESGEVLANTHLTPDQVEDVLALSQHWLEQ